MKLHKLVLSMVAASTMFIAARGVAHAGGYGDAGCGLGAILFGDKPGLVQVFAATTNAVFGNQTFGITSGTSGCGASNASAGLASAKSYVETNRQVFAKDVARGQGETISNLSQLAGCADPSAVAAKLQSNFKTVFPSASVSDVQVSTSTVNLLKSDAALKCSKLI